MEASDSPASCHLGQKQAACLVCRRSKIRCIRTAENAKCRRCENIAAECVVPPYRVGRYPGVKNKLKGLDKAIDQVERALKKSKTKDSFVKGQQVQALHQLLQNAAVEGDSNYDQANSSDTDQESEPHTYRAHTDYNPERRVLNSEEATADDGIVDNVDNPLQLLAFASSVPPRSSTVVTATPVNGPTSGGDTLVDHAEHDTQAFFRPLRTKLDIGPDLDPIDLGLATEKEAEDLFDFFHQYLAHTRWGLDKNLHTFAFVRLRSAFLLTSVMAASALFLPGTSALSKRLHNHSRKMARKVIVEKFRSTEIVLAFMVNVPWMIPGDSWAADDETCYYISMALTMSLDLILHRVILKSSASDLQNESKGMAKAETIDASKALHIDGFDHLDSLSKSARRVLRTRERVWLALFNLDRGVCLARGRPPTVPITTLIERCDRWHVSEIAEDQDGALVSSTVLRRDFTTLVSRVRSACDYERLHITNGFENLKSMRYDIETFFEQWRVTWKNQVQQPDGKLPPYVEILASHTKLSAYCNVVNHPTATTDVRQFFRTAGLSSALNVIKTAIEAEPKLKSMPNNTVIMVSFAACFVFGLKNGSQIQASFVSSNIFALVEEVANVLIRIGSVPEHRKGASTIFGKHIKAIVRRSQQGVDRSIATQTTRPNEQISSFMQTNASGRDRIGLNHGDAFDFNDSGHFGMNFDNFPILNMTDDQIIQTIGASENYSNNSSDTPLMAYDENDFINWLDSWS